ncbi:uncharacterized protein LOC129913907 [Episyrphus balteatus]|uniref:uncharacterized protein LOC129913907 n=1 Tax=Episyrphus balteatus TaxID=286459 RepID=UPI002485976E|nr:uncharacterized protein LOC129913907 [Episyrphus balteatus]
MASSSLIVNTNSFCEEDLTTFLECSERIKKCEERQRDRWLKKAVLTNEEIFEASTIVTDDDLLSSRNDGEQSFLSKSASMEQLMKYFEEDVQVDSDQDVKKPSERSEQNVEGPLPSTGAVKKSFGLTKKTDKDQPMKSPLKNQTFTNIKPSDLKSIRKQSSAPSGSYCKASNNGQLDPKRKFVKLSDLDLIDQNFNKENSPKNDFKSSNEPIPRELNEYNFKSRNLRSILDGKQARANHQYLKPIDLNLTLKEWEDRYFQIIRNDLKPQDLNLTQEEWDKRYFELTRNDLKPVPASRFNKPQEDKPSKWEKSLKPNNNNKKSVKSKVQKIAEMFNGMITQMTKGTDQRFSNELSPEPAMKPPQPKARTKVPPAYRHVATPRSSPKPTPKPSPRLSKRPIKQTGCLIPEEVFTKLSVKDKALLFNKFMKEMSLKNPEFTIDPEEFKSAMEKNQNEDPAVGEVLQEKQETVMNLARELEAKIIFPRQTVSQAALAKPLEKKPTASSIHEIDTKTEEIKEDPVHLSTLTVVLKPSPNKADSTTKAPVIRRKISPTTVVVCPSMKRSNNQISSSIPIEAYAPPKKIRRTRPERSNSRKFTQNPNLEKLFYDWMKERHGFSFSIQSQEEKSPKKEESQEDNTNVEPEENIETDTTLKNDESLESEVIKAEVKVEISTKEEPVDNLSKSVFINQDPSESDSSLLTMPSSKVNTDESQTDQAKESPDADFEFLKPVRPPRKKKTKRATLTWKKDASIVEKLPLSTTDSDSDAKQQLDNHQPPQQKPKKPTNLLTDPTKGKKLIFKDSPSLSAQNSFEVDEAFLDFMNSPRKIRNAYTLTVMSSPSQKTDSILSNKSEAPAKPPRKGKSTKLQQDINESKFEDQGFETASTGYSPARINHKTSATFSVSPMQEKSPLFIKLNAELERRMSEGTQTPTAYSTPVKNNLNSSGCKITPVKKTSWHTVFSPVQSNSGRRRSLADSESRRSSIVMDVIREEQQQQLKKPDSPDVDDDVFDPPTTPSTDDVCRNRKSSFWITIDDLTLSMEICENPKDRLSLLSDIFSQKSAETKMVHFGIDDLKYSPKEAAVNEDISKNLPKIDGVSHYWFASGDLAVPFQGNFISPDRVKDIFTFIRDSQIKDGRRQLSFGVDDVEFSKIPDPVSPGPKFSIESSYSMLIGLNGKSNDCNKFTWPSSSRNSTPFKTSDFDPSEFDSDSFEVSEIGRLSFSPYGGNYFDMASMQSGGERSSAASFASTGSPEMFTFEYENEPLDKMFGKKKTTSPTSDTFVLGKSEKNIKMPKPLPPTDSMTVDKMIETIRRQQHKLQNLETDMKTTCTTPAGFTTSVLDKYHGRPYVRKLHNIVRSIQIIAKTGFENCSAQQLESFLYFLSLYAETCLSSCSNQMNVILEQLSKNKGIQV